MPASSPVPRLLAMDVLALSKEPLKSSSAQGIAVGAMQVRRRRATSIEALK